MSVAKTERAENLRRELELESQQQKAAQLPLSKLSFGHFYKSLKVNWDIEDVRTKIIGADPGRQEILGWLASLYPNKRGALNATKLALLFKEKLGFSISPAEAQLLVHAFGRNRSGLGWTVSHDELLNAWDKVLQRDATQPNRWLITNPSSVLLTALNRGKFANGVTDINANQLVALLKELTGQQLSIEDAQRLVTWYGRNGLVSSKDIKHMVTEGVLRLTRSPDGSGLSLTVEKDLNKVFIARVFGNKQALNGKEFVKRCVDLGLLNEDQARLLFQAYATKTPRSNNRYNFSLNKDVLATKLQGPSSVLEQSSTGNRFRIKDASLDQVFKEALNNSAPGTSFGNWQSLKSYLANMGISIDDTLAQSIFEAGRAGTAETRGRFRVSQLKAWTFNPNNRYNHLKLISRDGNLSLELKQPVVPYNRLRFTWTGDADTATLYARLTSAGYQVNVSEIRWLIKAFGKNGSISWKDILRLKDAGVLKLTDKKVLNQVVSVPAALAYLLRNQPGSTTPVDLQTIKDTLSRVGIYVDDSQLRLLAHALNPTASGAQPKLSFAQLADQLQANNGALSYALSSDGDITFDLRDSRATLIAAINQSALFDKPLNASQLQQALKDLTGFEITEEQAQSLVKRFGSDGVVDRADVLKMLEKKQLGISIDSSRRLVLSVEMPGTAVDAQITGSAQAYAAIIRTPTTGNKFDKGFTNLLFGGTLDAFVTACETKGGGYSIGGLYFRAEREAEGRCRVQMWLPGGKWTTVFSGAANSVVDVRRTYELDLGVTGSYAYNTAAPGSSSGTHNGNLSGYTRSKPFYRFWVREANGGKSFRARCYVGVKTDTVGWNSALPDVNNLSSNLLQYDLRWGRISGALNAATAPTLNEWGGSVNVSVNGIDHLLNALREGDIEQVKKLAIKMPRFTFTLAYWKFGLFQVQKSFGAKATELRELRAGETQVPRSRNWLAKMLQTAGECFQHWGLVGTLNFGLGAVSGTTTSSARTQTASARAQSNGVLNESGSSSGSGLSGLEQLADTLSSKLPFTDLVDSLQQVVNSPAFRALSGSITTAVNSALLGSAFFKALKKKNFSGLEDLTGAQRDELTDRVFWRAFELVLEESLSAAAAGGEAGSPEALRKSILRMPNESVADYGARLAGLISGKLGQAAKEVLADETSWKDILENSIPQPSLNPPRAPRLPTKQQVKTFLAAALAASIAGAIVARQSETQHVNAGNTDDANAMRSAREALEKAQQLLTMLSEGGGDDDGAGGIEKVLKLIADAETAIESLGGDEAEQVKAALKTVKSALLGLQAADNDLQREALGNLLGDSLDSGLLAVLPNALVSALLVLDPAVMRRLLRAGVELDFVPLVARQISKEDFVIPGFAQTLQRLLVAASADGTEVTSAEADNAVLRARYNDLTTDSDWQLPNFSQYLGNAPAGSRQEKVHYARAMVLWSNLSGPVKTDDLLNALLDLSSAQLARLTALGVTKLQTLLERGLTVAQILAATPAQLNVLSSGDANFGLIVKTLLDSGMKVPDVASYAKLVRYAEVTETADASGKTFASALRALLAGGMDARQAIIHARYRNLASATELADKNFVKDLQKAEDSGWWQDDPNRALLYARGHALTRTIWPAADETMVEVHWKTHIAALDLPTVNALSKIVEKLGLSTQTLLSWGVSLADLAQLSEAGATELAQAINTNPVAIRTLLDAGVSGADLVRCIALLRPGELNNSVFLNKLAEKLQGTAPLNLEDGVLWARYAPWADEATELSDPTFFSELRAADVAGYQGEDTVRLVLAKRLSLRLANDDSLTNDIMGQTTQAASVRRLLSMDVNQIQTLRGLGFNFTAISQATSTELEALLLADAAVVSALASKGLTVGQVISVLPYVQLADVTDAYKDSFLNTLVSKLQELPLDPGMAVLLARYSGRVGGEFLSSAEFVNDLLTAEQTYGAGDPNKALQYALALRLQRSLGTTANADQLLDLLSLSPDALYRLNTFSTESIQSLLGQGFSLAQISTASSENDLTTLIDVIDDLKSLFEGSPDQLQPLLDAIQQALADGWTLQELAQLPGRQIVALAMYCYRPLSEGGGRQEVYDALIQMGVSRVDAALNASFVDPTDVTGENFNRFKDRMAYAMGANGFRSLSASEAILYACYYDVASVNNQMRLLYDKNFLAALQQAERENPLGDRQTWFFTALQNYQPEVVLY